MPDRSQPETLDVVRARRVEIIDADGRLRAVLGDLHGDKYDDGPFVGLSLLDLDGTKRVTLMTHAQGADFEFEYGGNQVMILSVHDLGSESASPGTYLTLCAGDGTPVLAWHVTLDGASHVETPVDRA